MKKLSKQVIQASIIGFVLPAILFTAVVAAVESSPPDDDTRPTATTSTTAKPTEPMKPSRLQIPVIQDGEISMMDLEEYLVGVLLAEMPASFEVEALKAQAVAARTFALKCHMDGYKHDKGAVCTNFACCQAYLSPENYLDRGWSERNIQKVRRAVTATEGQVLTYDGKLILATYFACSGGSTEDAAAVWGQEYPYLQAVPSPGEEETIYYTDSKSFSPEEFQKALGVALHGEPELWFGVARHTEGGGVETMEIGGVSYRGTTLRSLLELRSTVFSVRVQDGQILFETRGYGHRVGMSQYGADALAMAGKTYQQILTHYYQGAQIQTYGA